MVRCEYYVRASVDHPWLDYVELTVGVEYTTDDDVEEMTLQIKDLARTAAWAVGEPTGFHAAYAEAVKAVVNERYPGRAFFVETDELGRGVQVYQPFGMPRELCAACGGKLCH